MKKINEFKKKTTYSNELNFMKMLNHKLPYTQGIKNRHVYIHYGIRVILCSVVLVLKKPY